MRQTEHNQTFWQTNGWSQQKLPKFDFCTDTTTLWQKEWSSIVSVKFDCPVARQNLSLLATAHDCETDLSKNYLIVIMARGPYLN